jgi:hypothetical protein
VIDVMPDRAGTRRFGASDDAFRGQRIRPR